MVVNGVLNSWVTLLIKSEAISAILFCFIQLPYVTKYNQTIPIIQQPDSNNNGKIAFNTEKFVSIFPTYNVKATRFDILLFAVIAIDDTILSLSINRNSPPIGVCLSMPKSRIGIKVFASKVTEISFNTMA